MKKSILLSAFIVFALSAFAQFKFHVGGGPMLNFGDFDLENIESKPAGSFFGEIGFGYQFDAISPTLNLQYSRVEWRTRQLDHPLGDDAPDGRFRFNYLIVNPSVEYLPIKKLGVSIGGFYAHDMQEEFFNTAEGKFETLDFDFWQDTDFGIQLGVNFYFMEDLSIGLNYLGGYKSLADFQLTDNNGNPIGMENNTRNRSLQLKVAYSQ